MPLNIENAESAFLGGFARFEEWKARFDGKWFAPIGEMQRDLLVRSLPEPVKVELRRRAPRGMEVLEGGGSKIENRRSKIENGESRIENRRSEMEKAAGGGFRFGGDVDKELMS